MDLAKAHVKDQPFDNIFELDKGFMYGTIFPSLYDEYKYKPNMVYKTNDKRKSILYAINCYSFTVNDLVLYLDTHPDNKECLDLLNQVRVELIKLYNYYNENFPALTLFAAKDTYDYINSPWP